MANIKTYLPKDKTQMIANELQPILLDLSNMALLGKQLHWTVTGTNFRPVHLQLDEVVDYCRLQADRVAERLSALGQPPDGRAKSISEKTTLDDVPVEFINDRTVVNYATERLYKVTQQLRNHRERIAEADPVTENMVLEILEGLEKHLWMMSAQLA